MANTDRYGIVASFEFKANDADIARIGKVTQELRSLESAARSAAQSLSNNPLAAMLHQLSTAMSQVNRVAGGSGAAGLNNVVRTAGKAKTQVQGLASKFRVLRSEARNIDFGDLDDPNAFQAGKAAMQAYITELKQLEAQITGTDDAARMLKADLQRTQRIAEDKIGLQEDQRKAAVAQQRLGMANAVKQGGQSVLNFFQQPLEEAKAFNKELAGVQKLADGVNADNLTKSILTMSTELATSRSEVSGVYADLAASGADFSDMGAVDQRVRAILEVKTALEVTAESATGLQKQLALSMGKENVVKYGGLATLTTRVGSAINVMADNLENASVSGTGVLQRLPLLVQSIGDKANFPIDRMVALSAVFESMGFEASLGANFVGRAFAQMGAKTDKFAEALGMTNGQFKEMFEADAYGTFQMLAAKLGSITSDLDKRVFLKDLGFGGAEDQKVLLALANGQGMLAQAAELSSNAMEENTSIAKELRNVQKGSTFQSDKAAIAIQNLKTQLATAVDNAAVPFLSVTGSIVQAMIEFNSKFPQVAKYLSVGVYVLGGLAVAGGTVAAAFFGLSAAAASASAAMRVMKTAGVPLTGFFETAMTAFAEQGIVAGFTALGAQVSAAGSAFAAFATGPVGIAIGAILALMAIVQAAAPAFNVLGSVLSVVGGTIGAVAGFVKGTIDGVVAAFQPLIADIKSLVSELFPATNGVNYFVAAFKMAGKAFSQFFGIGKKFGLPFGKLLGTVLVLPLRAIVKTLHLAVKAARILGSIVHGVFKAIAFPVQAFVIGPLSAVIWAVQSVANWFGWAASKITTAWQGFVTFFTEMPLVKTALDIATGLINALNHNPTERIPEAWESAVARITDSLNFLLTPAKLIAGGLNAILSAPGQMLDGAMDVGRSVFSGVAAFAQSGATTAQGAWQALQTWFTGLSLPTPRLVTEPLSNAADWVRSRWEAVGSWFNQLDLSAPFQGIPAVLSSLGAGFTGMFGVIAEGWGGFVTWFLSVPLVQGVVAIGQSIGAALTAPAQWFGEAWQWATQTFGTVLTGVQGFAAQVGSAIVSILDPGRLLGGLLDGALSMIRQVVTAIQNSGVGRFLGDGLDQFQAFLDQAQNRKNPATVATPEAPPPMPPTGGALSAFPAFTMPALPTMPKIEMPQLNLAAVEQKAVVAGQRAAITFNDSFDASLATLRSGGSIGRVFELDSQRGRDALGSLGSAVWAFAKDATKSLLTLDFGGLTESAQTFGASLGAVSTVGAGALGSLALSALGFGVAALASLSPVVLVVGGLAAGVLAVTTNFLGLRTILGGVVKVIQGAWEIGRGIVEIVMAIGRTALEVGQSILRIFGGIPAALRGDFSQMGAGFTGVLTALQTGFLDAQNAGSRVFRGISTAFEGMGQIARGVAEGVQQAIHGTVAIAQGSVAAFKAIGQTLGAAFDGLMALPARVRGVTDALGQRWEAAKQAIASNPLQFGLGILESIPDMVSAVAERMAAGWRAGVQLLQSLIPAVDLSRLESVPQVIGGLVDRVTGLWRSAVEFVSGLPLVADGSGLARLSGVASGVSETVQTAWRGLVSFVAGLPLAAAWGEIQQLPARVESAVQTVRSVWQAGVDFVSGLAPRIDVSQLTALPGRVGDAMATVKATVSGVAESITAPFVGAVEKIEALWTGLTDKIAAPLSGLVEKAKGFGLGLIRNLAENSPGPTFQIREKWQATIASIEGGLAGFVDRAKTTGTQIAGNLGDKASSQLGKLSGAFTQTGVLLSNISPALGAPFFVLNDVLDSADMVRENLPALQKGFAQVGGFATQNAQKLGGFAAMLRGKVVGAIGSLVPVLSGLPALASTVWAGVLAPALPFIAIAAGIGLAVFGLYKAFQSNFLGIRDLANAVLGGLVTAFQGLLFPIQSAIDALKGAWTGFKDWFGGLLSGLPGFAKDAGQGLIDALNHNPTVKIPIAWEAAKDRIVGTMGGMVQAAGQAGAKLAESLSDTPQLGATEQPQNPGAIVVPVEIAKTDGLTQLQQQIVGARDSAVDFGRRSDAAVGGALQTGWQQITEKAGQFQGAVTESLAALPGLGDRVRSAMSGVTSQFGWATAGALGFGVTALAGLSPVILVIGAIALGALSIATNFLGARTVVKGLAQTLQGLGETAAGVFEMASGAVRGFVGVVKGVLEILGGIPAAIRGDFSQVQAGFDQVSGAIRGAVQAVAAGADQAMSGVRQALDGVVAVGQGVVEGFQQIGRVVGSVFDGAKGAIAALTGALDQVAQLPSTVAAGWSGLTERIGGAVSAMSSEVSARFDALKATVSGVAESIAAPFVGAVEKIEALWQGLTEKVGGLFGGLLGKAAETGKGLISRLAENSPGPTFQIRQRWGMTVEAIEGHLEGLATTGAETGRKLAGSLGSTLQGKLGKLSGGLTQAGVLLSNVSPALAAPFFVLNDVLDTAGMVGENLPAIQGGLSKIGSVAGKLPTVFAGMGSAIAGAGSSLLALVGPVAAGIWGALVPAFGAIATAAGAAWSAVIAPALPFIAVAAGIVAAIWLIKKAFDSNFLGMRDLVTGVLGAIGAAVDLVLAPFRAMVGVVQGAIDLVTGGWEKISGTVSGVLGFLPNLAKQAGEGLVNALNHNPTVRIPLAWENARGEVAGSINELVPVAVTAGDRMAVALSSQPVIQPQIAAPIGVGEVPSLPTATQTIQQQVEPPTGNATPMAPIPPQALSALSAGISGVVSQFSDLKAAASDAIGAIDVDPVSQSFGVLGDQVSGVLDTLRSGFSDAMGAAIGFAVASLPALLPVGLVLGGVALAGLAVATNFLGMRTVAEGLVSVVTGLAQALGQILGGAFQVLQGVVTTMRGLFAALRGDFSLLGQGFEMTFGGMRTVAGGFATAFSSLVSGISTAIRGLLEGLGQAFGAVNRLLGGALDGPKKAFESMLATLTEIGNKVGSVGQAITNSPIGRMFGGSKAKAEATMPIPEPVEIPVKLGIADRLDLAEQTIANNQALQDFDNRLNGSASGLQGVSAGLSNLGTVATAIAPQLAGPLGMLGGMVDGVLGLVTLLPGLGTILSGLAAGTVTVGGLMSAAFAGIATAAGAAWAAITGPLLPIVAGIALVGAAIWAIGQNVGGLGDAFKAAWDAAIAPVFDAFRGAFEIIGSALNAVSASILGLFGTQATGQALGFKDLMVGVFTVILTPVRLVATVLGWLITALAHVVAGVITVGGAIVKTLIAPLQLLWRVAQWVGGGLVSVLGGAIEFLSQPMRGVIWAVGKLGAGFAALWDWASPVIGAIGGALLLVMTGPIRLLTRALGFLGSVFGAVFGRIGELVSAPFRLLQGWLTAIPMAIGSVFNAAMQAMSAGLQFLWGLVPSPVRWLIEQAASGIGAIFGLNQQPQQPANPVKMATGGLVTGPGGPTADRVPAMLSAGEFVMPAAVTAANYDLLEAMRSGEAMSPLVQPMALTMPTISPETVAAVSAMGRGNTNTAQPSNGAVNVTVNLGGVTVQVNGGDSAQQVANELAGIFYSPDFQLAVHEAMREAVEKMR